MTNKKGSILFIPKWFPGRLDPQNGVFILKHAQAIAPFYPIKILHLCAVKKQDSRIEFETEQFDDIEVLHCYYKSFGSGLGKILSFGLYLLAFLKGYKKLYPEGKPLVSHAHVFTRTAFLAYILKVWKGIPYLVSEHSSVYMKAEFQQYAYLKKYTMRFLAKRSEAITAVSEVLLLAIQNSGLKAKCMQVIGNAVPAPKDISTNKEKKIIGLVADFDDANKRISSVILAFSELAETYPEWELHIVGGGKDEERLLQLARSKDLLNKQIRFFGRQDNTYVYQFLKDIAFLVNYSQFETFSVVLIEAILHGKPVISSKSGGPESFINEENGVLIDKNDSAALKVEMQKMIQTYKSYNTEKLIASLDGKYSPENIGKQFEILYTEILSDYAQ